MSNPSRMIRRRGFVSTVQRRTITIDSAGSPRSTWQALPGSLVVYFVPRATDAPYLSDGETETRQATLYFEGQPDVRTGDRITGPDGTAWEISGPLRTPGLVQSGRLRYSIAEASADGRR